MAIENNLSITGSNVLPELANMFARKVSNLILANKTIATIKQKENAFLANQNLNNIANNNRKDNIKNNQNTGLEKEKPKFSNL